MSAPDLTEPVVAHLRSIHVVKTGALTMFDPMLSRVAAERDDPDTSDEVVDLLVRMHSAFSSHREETAAHVQRVGARLLELHSSPASHRASALSFGARAWVAGSGIGGQNHGGNARNAFVFEHYEIASLKLLEQLAERHGDDETLGLARSCLAEDEAMAATINRNWSNVLTLTLAG